MWKTIKSVTWLNFKNDLFFHIFLLNLYGWSFCFSHTVFAHSVQIHSFRLKISQVFLYLKNVRFLVLLAQESFQQLLLNFIISISSSFEWKENWTASTKSYITFNKNINYSFITSITFLILPPIISFTQNQGMNVSIPYIKFASFDNIECFHCHY